MKKCEIAKILEDLTPEKLAEVSDLLVEKLGESLSPDLAATIDQTDAEPQSWIEGDRRFQCENVKKGRLCMRKEITDPAVIKKLTDELTKTEKKPDPSLEDLLTPDNLREKKGPAKPTIEDELTPDSLRSDEK